MNLAQRPTPLTLLDRASDRWGRGKRLWVKRDDLTGSTLTGNKVRKLEFFAAHANQHGYTSFITCGGLQSNHARATAGVCAQLGLHCELVLRGRPPLEGGNTLLDALFGAQVTPVEPREYVKNLEALLHATADRHRQQGYQPLVIPTGGSNGLGIWGYIAAAEELIADMAQARIEKALVVCATGSGGTQAGLTAGFALLSPESRVLGMAVCDDEHYFKEKVLDDVEQAKAHWADLSCPPDRIFTNDSYIGAGYGIAGPEVYKTIGELAGLEGIVLDPVYTGKAFYGLITELKKGEYQDAEDIIFVHTGGVFGVFPHEQGLREALSHAG